MSESSLALTRLAARFAIGAHDFPPLARARARDAIADCVGCMLAGSREPLAAPLRATLPSFDAASREFPALMIGLGRYAAPADAALYNGTVAHALDFDDTNHPAYAHPTAVIASAMFAVAPLVDASGDALIDAYLVGFEFFGKLGRALNTQHYKRGWHTTGTFGALAAAASAARLLGLDEQRTTMALGIAASSASGLRASFGSMTKPLHAGQAARNGVLAALMAREGFTASAAGVRAPLRLSERLQLRHRLRQRAARRDGRAARDPHRARPRPQAVCGLRRDASRHRGGGTAARRAERPRDSQRPGRGLRNGVLAPDPRHAAVAARGQVQPALLHRRCAAARSRHARLVQRGARERPARARADPEDQDGARRALEG